MLNPTHTALLVIDIQGKLAEIVHKSEELIRNTQILIQGIKLFDMPILVTAQYPKGLGNTIPAIAEHLQGIPVYEKNTFSCCDTFDFEARLIELHCTDIIVCGIETHVCVYQTARDLVRMGYQVHLVTDAVSSRTEANKQLGIRRIEALGGCLTGVEMILFDLLRESGTDRFRAISKLVR